MTPMPKILTTEQLAEELGDVPVNTIHYWRAQGTGPKGIKVGKRVLYRWSDVETWLDERADADEMNTRSRR